MKIKNLIRMFSLAVVSVGILSFTPGDKTKKKNMNQVNVSDSIIQNIMTRTSVRTYQQRAVEQFLNVDSFPTYKLIDKQGNIHDLHWLHTNDMKTFKETIANLN